MLGWKTQIAEGKELQMLEDFGGKISEIKFEIAEGPVAIYRFRGTQIRSDIEPMIFTPHSNFAPCEIDSDANFTCETQDVAGWIVSVTNCRYRIVQVD